VSLLYVTVTLFCVLAVLVAVEFSVLLNSLRYEKKTVT